MKITPNILEYQKYYSEEKLWKKVSSLIGKASAKLLYYVLLSGLLLTDKSIPKKVRITFVAALGYFILPTDLIADILPVMGYADDIAFLSYVLHSASKYITPELEQKAKYHLDKLINRQQ